MFLLDSDIAIWILRENKEITAYIEELSLKGETAISVITVTEIYKNIFPSEVLRAEAFIKEHQVLSVTETIAKDAGLYWQQFHPKLANLHIFDCMIAATAKDQGATLVTINTRHFPMEDIKILNPLVLK